VIYPAIAKTNAAGTLRRFLSMGTKMKTRRPIEPKVPSTSGVEIKMVMSVVAIEGIRLQVAC
jgi:hypothetical protein